MRPLIVLLLTSAMALIAIKIFSYEYDFALAGRIGMSVMLVFTAIGHFVFSKSMAIMVPAFIPFKTAIVYVTGVLEIVAAICLLIPATQVLTGWFLVLFFVVLLPANINAAIHGIDYQKAGGHGPGLTYLWFRVPLQIFFIAWTYFSAIRI
jgi:uncharacterized membrane protein